MSNGTRYAAVVWEMSPWVLMRKNAGCNVFSRCTRGHPVYTPHPLGLHGGGGHWMGHKELPLGLSFLPSVDLGLLFNQNQSLKHCPCGQPPLQSLWHGWELRGRWTASRHPPPHP